MDDSGKVNAKTNGAPNGVSNGDIDHDDSEDDKDDEAGAGEAGAPGGMFPHNSGCVLVFTKALQLPKRRRRESQKRRRVLRAVLKYKALHLESPCPTCSLVASIRKAR